MNLSTFIVLAVLIAIVFLVIRKMVKDKKSGNHCCGGSCSGCGNSAACESLSRLADELGKKK